MDYRCTQVRCPQKGIRMNEVDYAHHVYYYHKFDVDDEGNDVYPNLKDHDKGNDEAEDDDVDEVDGDDEDDEVETDDEDDEATDSSTEDEKDSDEEIEKVDGPTASINFQLNPQPSDDDDDDDDDDQAAILQWAWGKLQATKNSEGKYTCFQNDCPKSYVNERIGMVVNHIRNRHMEQWPMMHIVGGLNRRGDGLEARIFCTKCPDSFGRKDQILYHMREEHGAPKSSKKSKKSKQDLCRSG